MIAMKCKMRRTSCLVVSTSYEASLCKQFGFCWVGDSMAHVYTTVLCFMIAEVQGIMEQSLCNFVILLGVSLG